MDLLNLLLTKLSTLSSSSPSWGAALAFEGGEGRAFLKGSERTEDKRPWKGEEEEKEDVIADAKEEGALFNRPL
jgi:hypothetical protein